MLVSEGSVSAEAVKAAIRRRDGRAALVLLSQFESSALGIDLLLDKALALRLVGDLQGAVGAIDAALAIEPAHFLALLSKGALLERLGRPKAAAVVYAAALAVAPPADRLPPELATPVARAREAERSNAAALADYLQAAVDDQRRSFPGEDLDRFDESLDIFAGLSRAPVQEPLLLHYPRLPAIPFYDRTLFPWLVELEAGALVIQAECREAMEACADEFIPYIARPPGAPVNQWRELNHSRRWSTFYFWRDGARQDEPCAACPRTAALLARLPMMDAPGFAPTAMFSLLEAGTRIPAHTGSTNVRLVVHLPLVLPGPARFRVGNRTRDWRLGEAWVFDDTIEHEAWNDADAPRVILILDVWNPLLTAAERALVARMMAARRAFEAEP